MITSIEIHMTMNGWLVRAGCQCLCYTNRDLLLSDLATWVDDPVKAEAAVKTREDRFRQFKDQKLSPAEQRFRGESPAGREPCCEAPQPSPEIGHAALNTLRR